MVGHAAIGARLAFDVTRALSWNRDVFGKEIVQICRIPISSKMAEMDAKIDMLQV